MTKIIQLSRFLFGLTSFSNKGKWFNPGTMSVILVIICIKVTYGQDDNNIFPGADEQTPSRAQYFSWINNTNEGATEEHTLINLEFFKWLHDEYGMILDIYAFDAGAIDGKRFYGSVDSERFRRQFPNGFDPLYRKAKSIGTRLGIWVGPDGFGDTQAEEKARTDQMVGLCKDYEFALFKFDAVCGPLRKEKEDAFINMMTECRKYSPDLILLNHRLGLDKAKPYATTFLWEGKETYIDVFSTNSITAPHHRADALSRGLPPDLVRLTEDHGTCLSSCLDYWDDDLILQAFNRCLILAPEIYANPWLLRDDEFPKLARIYKLHRKYRDIMVDGMTLPETYGPYAVSRGDKHRRILTLRNLNWNDKIYNIRLDEEIGMDKADVIEVRQFHPTEKILGYFNYGDVVEVPVASFRSCMLYAGSKKCDEPAVFGTDFQVARNAKDKPIIIKLLGMPGTKAKVALIDPDKYSEVQLDGEIAQRLMDGKRMKIEFPGTPYKNNLHRKIADLEETELPEDAEALYEATVYAADNNALEVRSIQRSGWSDIPEVKKAQDAFFDQDVFIDRGIWDKYLFDNDMKTGFWQSRKYNIDQSVKGGCFRLDLGDITEVDEIVIHVPDYFSLHPMLRQEGYYAYVSEDLKEWQRITFLADTVTRIPVKGKTRFVKLNYFPQHMVEIEAFKDGVTIDRDKWRASNLFAPAYKMKPHKAWQADLSLDEIPENSYLCIAINGEHGIEGAYAAAKIDVKYAGCPDRAASFPSNTWEFINARRDRNYTYYLPLTPEMKNKLIEVFVLSYEADKSDLKPEVWISAYPMSYKEKELLLKLAE